jgi:hypothetical protein
METCPAKDLAIGDIIQVDGLEDDQVVRKAQRIREGLDAGLLHLTLVARDGDVERIALAPEERVTFVSRSPKDGKGPQPKAVAAPAPQLPETPAPIAEPLRSNPGRLQEAKTVKRMSCLDAAAKLLTETGQPMTCQELIAAMAAKGYWTSPAGKTPQATLYAGIVREMRTKKERARFRKMAPGRFALA